MYQSSFTHNARLICVRPDYRRFRRLISTLEIARIQRAIRARRTRAIDLLTGSSTSADPKLNENSQMGAGKKAH